MKALRRSSQVAGNRRKKIERKGKRREYIAHARTLGAPWEPPFIGGDEGFFEIQEISIGLV